MEGPGMAGDRVCGGSEEDLGLVIMVMVMVMTGRAAQWASLLYRPDSNILTGGTICRP